MTKGAEVIISLLPIVATNRGAVRNGFRHRRQQRLGAFAAGRRLLSRRRHLCQHSSPLGRNRRCHRFSRPRRLFGLSFRRQSRTRPLRRLRQRLCLLGSLLGCGGATGHGRKRSDGGVGGDVADLAGASVSDLHPRALLTEKDVRTRALLDGPCSTLLPLVCRLFALLPLPPLLLLRIGLDSKDGPIDDLCINNGADARRDAQANSAIRLRAEQPNLSVPPLNNLVQLQKGPANRVDGPQLPIDALALDLHLPKCEELLELGRRLVHSGEEGQHRVGLPLRHQPMLLHRVDLGAELRVDAVGGAEERREALPLHVAVLDLSPRRLQIRLQKRRLRLELTPLVKRLLQRRRLCRPPLILLRKNGLHPPHRRLQLFFERCGARRLPAELPVADGDCLLRQVGFLLVLMALRREGCAVRLEGLHRRHDAKVLRPRGDEVGGELFLLRRSLFLEGREANAQHLAARLLFRQAPQRLR